MTVYIGITGLPASGKEIVKDLLLKKLGDIGISSYHWSMSNDVRREAELTVGKYTREILQATSKRLKSELGPAAMAIRTVNHLKQLKDRPDVVIMEAIKNSHEVEYFRSHLGDSFLLVGVDAPADILVDRIMARKRYDEDNSVLSNRASALEMITREEGTPHSTTGFDIGYCLQISDYRINNESDLLTLSEKVGEFIQSAVKPLITKTASSVKVKKEL